MRPFSPGALAIKKNRKNESVTRPVVEGLDMWKVRLTKFFTSPSARNSS